MLSMLVEKSCLKAQGMARAQVVWSKNRRKRGIGTRAFVAFAAGIVDYARTNLALSNGSGHNLNDVSLNQNL
ncbi:MAG: hypothetical protein DHS20C16_31610 [Phycisphaerae bacterium]|nr:MAG: hypothetical protein DHS20C16_31610 [Phycisphaerae bacterium]